MSETLRDLIAQWRKDAKRLRAPEYDETAYAAQWAETKEECADELEAALAALPAPQNELLEYATREALLDPAPTTVREAVEMLVSGGLRLRKQRDELAHKLLTIAGIVNGYHNDGASAEITLVAIADVLGTPMEPER